VEVGLKEVKAMKCENASINGTGVSVYPQCFNNEATREVTVIYNEVERDTLYLCNECTKNLKRDARKHGYKVITKRI